MTDMDLKGCLRLDDDKEHQTASQAFYRKLEARILDDS